jgi:hypothetical protein
MAQLQRSAVTLRIGGDDLIPDEITALVGASPTHTQFKGQQIIGKKTGTVRVAKSGLWRLCAADRKPEDMDGQIQEILSQMTDDLAVWQSIGSRFQIDLFCGLFLGGSNEGLTLSAKSLSALGARGIEMGLDIYSGDDDDETST